MADKLYAQAAAASDVDLSADPPVAGQRGVAVSVTDSTSTSGVGPGTGWTQIGTWRVTSVDAMSVAVWIKNTPFAGGETVITFTTSTVSFNFIAALDNIDGTTFLDVAAPTPAVDNTSSASPATISLAITPVTNGSRLMAVCGTDQNTNVNVTHAFAGTGGESWTTVADPYDTNWRNFGVGMADQATAAATTVTATSTFASSGAGQVLFVLAFRNASPPAGSSELPPLTMPPLAPPRR